ncbi:FAD-dependent oxidoreductase domain-containing protein 1-like isoform X2 [Zootermopsis nevadensis]|uniref:FAD-dependent oxidoreductase domain-containing protein 1-like isoform X2 n=1 Tax=Zootermopsis nevadensis TaxID=136037 RepID=UPI000B8E30AC|nr:FAD-dependent oxidoreductase domain-containing protein 1-like isoform X2 [Zootermopsis nevadensis]
MFISTMFKAVNTFKCRKFIKVKFVNLYKNACFCTNKSEVSSSYEPPKPENPFKRTFRILGNDMKTAKNKVQSFITKVQGVREVTNKVPKSPYRDGVFPEHCDIAIIGGGAMGSSIAYWLKQRAPNAITVTVIEKDPSYVDASTVLSVGGLRQQFSLEENIRMSLFGAEFLRNIKQHLSVEGHDPPDVQFTPFGYLCLASEEGAQQLEENANLQKKLGAKNELLTPVKLKQKFPWINTDGIALGCHGLENEGWFDPWSLLYAFKTKALSLGVEYVDGEAVGFEFKKMPDMLTEGVEPGSYEAVEKVLVKTESGELRSIKFGFVIIAAGPHSARVAKMARIGTGEGMLSIPLPVEPRKRYVFCINCKNGPGLNTPLTIDPSGAYFRREGLAGNYICGRSPLPEEEPSVDNLDVDYDFFDKNVWPILAKRVPAFESVKVKSAWSGYYEYNTYDENGIVGPHPYYTNLYIATGFSGHGIQHSPAVGRSVMEMILDGDFETIDLKRMSFDRLITDTPLIEQNIF